MDRIHLVALLTALIHLTDTLFYPVRLSGVRTRRLVTAISLYQLIALLAGVANMVQAPCCPPSSNRRSTPDRLTTRHICSTCWEASD